MVQQSAGECSLTDRAVHYSALPIPGSPDVELIKLFNLNVGIFVTEIGKVRTLVIAPPAAPGWREFRLDSDRTQRPG